MSTKQLQGVFNRQLAAFAFDTSDIADARLKLASIGSNETLDPTRAGNGAIRSDISNGRNAANPPFDMA